MDDEFKFIFDIGYKHKYTKPFLSNCLQAAKRTFYNLNNPQELEYRNSLVLPYNVNLEQNFSLLKSLGINLIFSNPHTIQKSLIKNSPQNENSIVYKIPCNNCNSFYVGQSGRGLSIRLKEHKAYIRKADESKAVFLHVSSKNHTIDWENASVIMFCKDYSTRNIFESIIIRKSSQINFNISPGLFNFDDFIVNSITKFHKIEDKLK